MSMIWTRWSWAGLAVALAGCAVEDARPPVAHTAAPLIGGTETTEGEDPAVVMLDSAGILCTGTLVSPSVVVTASHCVDGSGGGNTVFFGHDFNDAGRRVVVDFTTTHPDWNGCVGPSPACGHDIGLVLLRVPQDPELPVPMNREPASAHVGEPYRHVGFGTYGFQGTTRLIDGKKRQGTSTITGINPNDTLLTGDGDIRVCFGDSGGPGLLTLDGVEHLTGVHSYTSSQDCLAPMGDTRVDLYADSFVQPFIDEHDPACKRNGVCARIGCVDDPDCEPCGPNGECVTDCELPDWDCTTQELGEVCQADTQCTTGLCVYWQPEPQTKFCTIPCTKGGTDCPDGMECVTRPDVGDVCYFDQDNEPPGLVGAVCAAHGDCGSLLCEDGICTTECDLAGTKLCPVGFTCENRTGNGFHCYAPERGGGGCHVGQTSSGAAWTLLPALALFAATRRRRRRCA